MQQCSLGDVKTESSKGFEDLGKDIFQLANHCCLCKSLEGLANHTYLLWKVEGWSLAIFCDLSLTSLGYSIL